MNSSLSTDNSSVLRETKLESFGLAGCVVPPLAGGIIVSVLFWFLTPENDGDFEGMSESLGFLNILIGFCVGSFVFGTAAFIIDKFRTLKKAAAEEPEHNKENAEVSPEAEEVEF
ncbi:hypothetical protein IJT93_06555 [bacterium]|nr:hypothetical protein [bacterium]